MYKIWRFYHKVHDCLKVLSYAAHYNFRRSVALTTWVFVIWISLLHTVHWSHASQGSVCTGECGVGHSSLTIGNTQYIHTMYTIHDIQLTGELLFNGCLFFIFISLNGCLFFIFISLNGCLFLIPTKDI